MFVHAPEHSMHLSVLVNLFEQGGCSAFRTIRSAKSVTPVPTLPYHATGFGPWTVRPSRSQSLDCVPDELPFVE